MEKAKIDRINFLANKKKNDGLTEAEAAEQQALRREYIDEMKSGLQAQLGNLYVQDENGTTHKLEKKS